MAPHPYMGAPEKKGRKREGKKGEKKGKFIHFSVQFLWRITKVLFKSYLIEICERNLQFDCDISDNMVFATQFLSFNFFLKCQDMKCQKSAFCERNGEKYDTLII